MNKTIFDVDDIYELRVERQTEYDALPTDEARRLRKQRADNSWNEVAKIRAIINDYYKCGNVLTEQPDKLPAMRVLG
jgi:hypothetical protein